MMQYRDFCEEYLEVVEKAGQADIDQDLGTLSVFVKNVRYHYGSSTHSLAYVSDGDQWFWILIPSGSYSTSLQRDWADITVARGLRVDDSILDRLVSDSGVITEELLRSLIKNPPQGKVKILLVASNAAKISRSRTRSGSNGVYSGPNSPRRELKSGTPLKPVRNSDSSEPDSPYVSPVASPVALTRVNGRDMIPLQPHFIPGSPGLGLRVNDEPLAPQKRALPVSAPPPQTSQPSLAQRDPGLPVELNIYDLSDSGQSQSQILGRYQPTQSEPLQNHFQDSEGPTQSHPINSQNSNLGQIQIPAPSPALDPESQPRAVPTIQSLPYRMAPNTLSNSIPPSIPVPDTLPEVIPDSIPSTISAASAATPGAVSYPIPDSASTNASAGQGPGLSQDAEGVIPDSQSPCSIKRGLIDFYAAAAASAPGCVLELAMSPPPMPLMLEEIEQRIEQLSSFEIGSQ